LKSAKGLVIAEVPLLYENGAYKWCDGVVYAAATLKKRTERNKARGWDSKEVKRREAKLMPRKEKINHADWVLKNDGTLEEWECKARELGTEFIRLMDQKRKNLNTRNDSLKHKI
jgi:dephospho-CoA kinase